MLSDYHRNITACMRCEHCCHGPCPCPCRADRAGRDMQELARSGGCPLGRHANVPATAPEHERSVLRGMIGIAQAVTHAGRADDAVIARRRVICRGCPESIPSAIGAAKCRRCGCQLWAKTTLSAQRCPLGKW